MLTAPLVILAALAWLGLLFGAALWGERRPDALAKQWRYVYALSLAVYCTSWTFFGTVTQAQRSGWAIPPTFVGTIALYLLGFGLLQRLVALARERHSTSLADLIATRLGKSSLLAAAVTLVAVLGIVPYIALQLKAVTMSYGLLTRSADPTPPAWQDGALYVALAMALFAMLFGTRRASAMEHNRGLVLAMAAESLLKLGVMLALGVFVWLQGVPAGVAASPPPPHDASGFPALIALGALAMFTLPHQFHVGMVECKDSDHLRTARWLFPLYLLLIALPILPLARAGDALLGPLGIPSDLYVLALPLHAGNETLALFAFLGGLSAATGMLILSTLSLSVMIGNHWLTPLLLRGPWSAGAAQATDLRPRVLRLRRAGILAVMLLAWLYSRAIAGNDALADIGAVSFSALATLAPALGFAVWRPSTPPRAVAAGLAVAVAVWAWVLLAPAFGAAWGVPPAWLQAGPFGVQWLSPDALLGLDDWSPLGRAVLLSLGLGTAATLLAATRDVARPAAAPGTLPREALEAIAARLLAVDRIDQLLASLPRDAAGDAEFERTVERELGAVLGAASAQLLLDAARREPGRDFDTVAALVGEASQVLRFNQRLLEAALENMSQGISVVDADLRLVAWNQRYAERFDYPADLLRVGTPIEALLRWNLSRERARGGDDDALEAAIARRMAHMRAGTPYVVERTFGRGEAERVVEIRGNPMPGGGFVATFTDVTAFRRAEAELKRVAESLEQRVADRTVELEEVMVDVRFRRRLRRPITLEEIKARKALSGLALVKRGNRLSVMPVTEREWEIILGLE